MRKQYGNAVRTLQSRVNWSKREQEMKEYEALCRKQRSKLKDILDSGIDPMRVYQDLCKLRHEGEKESDVILRVAALGAARAGYDDYFKRYK